MRQKDPTRLVEEAVRGMLPKTKLGNAMYRKLKVYKLPMPEKPCFMSDEEANSIDLVNPRTAQDEPQIVEVWL